MSGNLGFEDDFLQEMLGDFLDESDDILGGLNDNLLKLEEWAQSLKEGQTARCDDELMNEMFRGAHSLKGLSGMLGLTDINTLTHKVENLFDAARNDQLTLNRDIVPVIFQSIDKISNMVDCLKDADADPVDCEEVSASIHAILENSGVERELVASAETEAAFNEMKDAVDASAAVPEPAEAVDHFASIEDETDVASKYLGIFIDESEESLDVMSDLLIGKATEENTKSLMIQCHKIKGSAASLGLQRAAKMTHFMEDLLQELLHDKQDLTNAMVEAMLRCTDSLRAYVSSLKAGATPLADFNEAYSLLVASQAAAGGESEAGKAQVAGDVQEAVADTAGLSDAVRHEIAARAPFEGEGWIIQIVLEPDTPMPGLKASLALGRLSDLGSVFYSNPPESDVENVAELNCVTLGFTTDQDAETIRSRVQLAGIDHLEFHSLSSSASQSEPAQPASQASDSPAPNASTPETPSSETPSSETPSSETPSSETPTSEKPASDDAKQPKAKTPAAASEEKKKPTETLRVDIERLDHLMNLTGQLVINKARFIQIGDGLKSLTASKQASHSLINIVGIMDRLSAELDKDNEGRTHLDVDSLRSQTRRIRMDLEHVQREVTQFAKARAMINDLTETVHQLDRVTDGIQKTVMDTRMVPIGPLFRRFKRVIRDITRGNGKDINLVIRGESTELDKRMIDELGDPLIHMVRNCADHGIESPSDRAAAGKPSQGIVTLEAFHRGNSILIEIRDDGKGLDVEKIRTKAIEKGLLSASDAEKLTPHQVYQLIWEPGLSTAEKVTEVSGRGMGMDIVRTKIEDINGTVELDSKIGEGTTVTIKLPLTLAILPSLLVEIDGDVIAMPVESVTEIVRVEDQDLSTVHGLPTATIRGRVISVVNLSELFSWNQPPKVLTDEEQSIVVIGADGVEVGLVVDNLLGEEDIVIKSMAENYRNVDGIAGASILGDGRVSLILDVGAVLDMSAHHDATHESDKELVQ